MNATSTSLPGGAIPGDSLRAAAPGGAEEQDPSPARLRIAVSRMSRRLKQTAAAGSLTTTEVDMLLVAERRGPARMSDFAVFCGLNPTMLSRLVPRLEGSRLLKRSADGADRRVSLIEVTPQATELLDRVRSERDDVLSRLLDALEPHERQAIAAAVPALEKLAERLRDQAGCGSLRR